MLLLVNSYDEKVFHFGFSNSANAFSFPDKWKKDEKKVY